MSKRWDEKKLIIIYLILCIPALYLYVFGLFWLWAVGGLIETPAILAAWAFLILFSLSKTKLFLKFKNMRSFFDKAIVYLSISYAVITITVLTLCARNLITEGIFALHD